MPVDARRNLPVLLVHAPVVSTVAGVPAVRHHDERILRARGPGAKPLRRAVLLGYAEVEDGGAHRVATDIEPCGARDPRRNFVALGLGRENRQPSFFHLRRAPPVRLDPEVYEGWAFPVPILAEALAATERDPPVERDEADFAVPLPPERRHLAR